jgi:homoserine dehydrogenase
MASNVLAFTGFTDPICATAPLRVALAGCGAVGSAFVRELTARRACLRERHGLVVELTAVLVRDRSRRRDAVLAAGLLDDDLERFLRTDADVVVEAIGGIEPARAIVESAIRRGATVLTANKELLAAHGSSLMALADAHGATLRYDAAVGGGVPVLRMIDDALGAGTPEQIRGILNGTSNYVLTGLERGGSLTETLAAARAAGFAEADATRDLDGRDAAAKLALVAWAAYGVAPEELVVRRASLLPDPSRHTRLAQRLGGVVRQIGECALVGGSVVASVEPVVVPANGAFALTRDEQNRVEVHTGWTAPLCASGPGAGGLPTATALLCDLLASGLRAPRASRRRSAVRDDRRFTWALEGRCAPALLHRLVPRRSAVRVDAEARWCWTMVEDATASTIDTILESLGAAGAEPVALRVDDLHGERALA